MRSGWTISDESKLVKVKQAWAKDGRLLGEKPTAARLPPGQRLVNNWPVLDLGVQPEIDKKVWRLEVNGECKSPFKLDWRQLEQLPTVELKNDIHCVTSWSMLDNLWRGVATSVICEKANLSAAAKFVLLESYDGYTTNMPLKDFLKPGSLLAHEHHGEPIAKEHGGPLRLVVPHLYFWKSPKWLSRITFAAADKRGFWEERGYHNYGDPWAEQRYSNQE